MSQMGEPGEIMASFVDLLHERSLHIDDAAVLQNAVNLGDTAIWIEHMFQHCLRNHSVK